VSYEEKCAAVCDGIRSGKQGVEIARELGIAEGTVWRIVHHARERGELPWPRRHCDECGGKHYTRNCGRHMAADVGDPREAHGESALRCKFCHLLEPHECIIPLRWFATARR